MPILFQASPDMEPHHQIFKAVLEYLPYQHWFSTSEFSISHPQWAAQTKYTWGLTLLSHSYYVARSKNTTMFCLCPGCETQHQEVFTTYSHDIILSGSVKNLSLNCFFLQVSHCSPLFPHQDSRDCNTHCTSHLAQHQTHWGLNK